MYISMYTWNNDHKNLIENGKLIAENSYIYNLLLADYQEIVEHERQTEMNFLMVLAKKKLPDHEMRPDSGRNRREKR